MKLFIWEWVTEASGSYHDGGGVLAVGEDLDAARTLIRAECGSGCGALSEEPDETFDVGAIANPHVTVFPDSGCC